MNADQESTNALKLGRLFHEEPNGHSDQDWMLNCERQLLREVRSNEALSAGPRFQSQSGSLFRKGLLAAALVGTLSAGVFFLGTMIPAGPTASVITFTAGDRLTHSSGSVVAEEQPKLIHFSDGSALSLSPGTRTRVGEATEHGATVVLEQGSVESSIIHNKETQWKVLLGAYEIRVIGTRFTSTWEPSTGEVSVSLHEGAVDIVGEGIQSGVQLKAGQRFDATREGIWKISAATTEPASSTKAAATAIEPSPEDEAEETSGVEPAIVDPTSKQIGSTKKDAATSWSHLIAEGKFQEVLNAAQDQGVDSCLRSCSTKNLRALSDAARYKGNTDLARRTLLRLRESAPSERARAGYLLGSLAEVQGQSSEALSWYSRYVSEAPGGLLLSEARAGRLRCLLQLGRQAEARKAAIQYLDMYPQGVGEKVARQILKKP